LSLSPPALLVCLNHESATLCAIRRHGAFAVNLLGAAQETLATRFSGSAGLERFALGSWRTLATGAPVLADALAAIDCRLESIVEHRTHAIVIGSAEAILRGRSGAALLHWRRRFESVG
jgi:flavin reductase (DIM6/NTAB) family NADH-FMN oxidoreductase RutF